MLLSALLPLLAPAADAVLPQHRADAVSHRTYELRRVTRVEDSALDLGEMGSFDPGVGMEVTRTLSLAVTEVCEAVDEGRATRVRRTFDAIEEDARSEAPEQDDVIAVSGASDRASELEEHTVVFEREGDGDWSARWATEDGDTPDDAWLACLAPESDFSAFLPSRAVEVGDGWEVESAALLHLFAPCGDLEGPPRPEPQLPEGGIALRIDEQGEDTWESLDGDVRVELAEVRATEAGRLAVLRLRFDVEGVQDLTERMGASASSYTRAERQRAWKGEGELLWNLDRGALAGLRVEAQGVDVTDQEWTQDLGGMDVELVLHHEESGELELSVEVE